MSWTPDNPVGFDPCGIAFGAIRAPYSAACKFYADDSGFDNRINWYVVPDDTPYYELGNAFWPRQDVPPDKALTYREREGPGRVVRRYDHGTTFLQPLPLHGVHGDEQDFLGLSPRSKFWIDDVAPEAPCPVIRMHMGGIRLGAKVRRVSLNVPAGLCFGARLQATPPPIRTAGLSLNARVVDYVPRVSAGLRFGATLLEPLTLLTAGVRFGATLLEPSRVLPAGVRFGAASLETTHGYSAGVMFGGELLDVTPTHTAGLMFGAETDEPLTTHDAGLLLGADAVPHIDAPTAGLLFGADLLPFDPGEGIITACNPVNALATTLLLDLTGYTDPIVALEMVYVTSLQDVESAFRDEEGWISATFDNGSFSGGGHMRCGMFCDGIDGWKLQILRGGGTTTTAGDTSPSYAPTDIGGPDSDPAVGAITWHVYDVP